MIEPERNLLAAILQRAVMDAFNETGGILPHQRRDAYQWLFYEDDSDRPFGFYWIMRQLDLDPHSFRRFVTEYEGDFSFHFSFYVEGSRRGCY